MSMVLDLLDEGQLMRNIERQLMKKVKVVPRTTVHSRRISFSRSQYTLVLSRELTLGLSCDDAQRLVLAAAPLIKENFPTISKADTKKILKKELSYAQHQGCCECRKKKMWAHNQYKTPVGNHVLRQ